MEVLLYQAYENGLTLGQALQICCTKLSVKLLSKLRYQDMISVYCNVNNLLPNVSFNKAILSHENCMSHSMSILSGKYIYPFFDIFVKNELCNHIINSMDWLYSNGVTFCIEQLHQVFQSQYIFKAIKVNQSALSSPICFGVKRFVV